MKNSVENISCDTLRQKAEIRLGKKLNKTSLHLQETESLKLLHELQVHQIELELQNEELILAKKSAETISEKYTELYDFAPSAYFTLNPNGEIIELNLAGAKMLGKERSKLINSHLVIYIDLNSRSKFNLFIEKVFQGYEKEICKLTMYGNNGLPIHVLLTGVARENRNQCFLTAVELTKSKQREMEIVKAKEKDEFKTLFWQNMSHEIKTPMNAIIGLSQILVKSFNDKPKLEKYVEIINQSCNDLLRIVNDLLDIEKIESGKMSVFKGKCDLNVLFEEITALFKGYQLRFGKEHIQLKMQANCGIYSSTIITDKAKLKQIFINLITNAFKFTDKGIIEGGCKYEQNKLLFYVSDTGIGIPQKKQDIIFERFTQVIPDEKRTVCGTGLGLSIVKGMVDLLGGEIFIDSEPGKGTTFYFSISC